jgi:hypothetical protein
MNLNVEEDGNAANVDEAVLNVASAADGLGRAVVTREHRIGRIRMGEYSPGSTLLDNADDRVTVKTNSALNALEDGAEDTSFIGNVGIFRVTNSVAALDGAIGMSVSMLVQCCKGD